MSTDKRFDDQISGWLEQSAPARLPDRVLEATFERTRTSRQQIGWRAGMGRFRLARPAFAVGGTIAAVLVGAVAFNAYTDRSAVGPGGPSPSDDPRSSFLGTWLSTSDADGGTQTMIVRASGEDGVEIVVTDTIAMVCTGMSSTMTGTGFVDGDKLVIPEPVYACDDGSEPTTASGPPLHDILRNLTYVHDASADVVYVGGAEWARQLAVAPSPEPTTSPSEAEITEILNGFLEARIAGEGAQQYLTSIYPEIAWEDIPLLYATSSGAPYERAEFEPVRGIEWPRGELAFKVRLFAGDTVVEQLFFSTTDGGPLGLKYDPHGYATEIAPTIEDGRPVTAPYSYFDGAVTLHAAHPWVMGGYNGGGLIPEGPGVRPTTDGAQRHDGWDELMLLADPGLLTADCQPGPVPADAEALAESIRSHPDLGATDPVAVTVGGTEALMMDVAIAAGAPVCLPSPDSLPGRALLWPVFDLEAPSFMDDQTIATSTATGERMRLYLMDAPEGSSMRILAIAIYGEESSLERAVKEATPLLDSIEFRAP